MTPLGFSLSIRHAIRKRNSLAAIIMVSLLPAITGCTQEMEIPGNAQVGISILSKDSTSCRILFTPDHESDYFTYAIGDDNDYEAFGEGLLDNTERAEGDSQTDTIEITVKSNAEWEMENRNEWLHAERSGKETILIAADKNAGTEERSGEITLSTATVTQNLKISQLGAVFEGKFEDLFSVTRAVISRNGRFLGCIESELMEDGWNYRYFMSMIDLETGEKTDYVESGYSDIVAITDDGTEMIVANSGNMEYAIFSEGETFPITVPQGYSKIGVENMSSDGRIIVGYAMDSQIRYCPVKWTDGTPEILPMPEINAASAELRSGVMARGCSSDGSVIYGSEWDNYGVVYWKDGQMHFPGLDYADYATVMIEDPWIGQYEGEMLCAFIMNAETNRISPNGKYLAGRYETAIDVGGVPTSGSVLAYMDLEKEELAILDEYEDFGSETMTDDGMLFCFIGSGSSGYAYDSNTGQMYTISEWFKNTYGIILSDDRVVTHIGENGTFFGRKRHNAAYIPWYVKP